MHTTEGIRHVLAEPDPTGGPGRWRLSFRSNHGGWCHQLYADGRLIAWTDAPHERAFAVDDDAVPRQLALAACPPQRRTQDASAALGLRADGAARHLRAAVPAGARAGDRLEVVDAGGAVLSSAPLATDEAAAFGQDAFGLGGFGFDGALAPGLGTGAFGVGPFGFDAAAVGLDVALPGDGPVQVGVRVARPGAAASAMQAATVFVHAPPAPPAALTCTSCDAATGSLRFAIDWA